MKYFKPNVECLENRNMLDATVLVTPPLLPAANIGNGLNQEDINAGVASTLQGAIQQRDALLAEAKQIRVAILAISTDLQNSSLLVGGFKAAAYLGTIRDYKNRIQEIRQELAAIYAKYPNMPPPEVEIPYQVGTPLPYVPPPTPPPYGD